MSVIKGLVNGVLIIGILTMVSSMSCAAPKGLTLYVSTSGNDSWSGGISAANKAKTDGPLATLIRARDLIREKRKAGTLQPGPFTVNIRKGVYRITESLELTSEDSGTKESPVIWRAQPGEEVRFIGGVRLKDWQPVEDASVLDRLDPEARKHVLQADMKKAATIDLGTPTPATGWRAELVFNNRYMTLARYPNEETWDHVASIPQGGTFYKTEYDSHYGRWAYSGDRPSRWKDVSDLWVHGYWVYDWSDQFQRVQALDLDKKEISPEPPYHGYGYKKGQRFYYLNIIEELDSPGEWFLDRSKSIIYFWPPSDINKAEVIFPELQKPVISLNGTQYINMRNLIFECTRNQAVVISAGDSNEIAGCTFRNLGGHDAVSIDGKNNGIRSCDIYEIAGIGVRITGGDRKTLTPANNYAVNNEIYRVGQVYRTYHGAFILDGVGQKIANCYIHDLPHQGIGYSGNDHIIEYCDFTRIAQETGDVGVTYAAADWTTMGHEFRYNYFHNIHSPGNLGCFTIYPDLPCGGINLHHNIFYDVDQIFHTNSGRGMVIENNIFAMNKRGMSFSAWGDVSMFQEGGAWKMVETLKAMNYDQPPFSVRYPALQQLAKDFNTPETVIVQRRLPKDNIIRRNVSMGNMFLSVDPQTSLDQVKMENNLIADETVFSGSVTGNGELTNYRNGADNTKEDLGKYGNIFVKGSPALVEVSPQGFKINASESLKKIGFEPIPFKKIGLYVDQYRKTLPLKISEPIITPASGAFIDKTKFRLTVTPQTGNAKTVLRYTLDGSEPAASSPKYAGPVEISKTVNVKAAAFAVDGRRTARSKTVSMKYRLVDLGSGTVYLSDLPERDLVCYAPSSYWKKDVNYLGMPITLHGKQYDKGLLLHPDQFKDGNYGHVTYDIAGSLRKARYLRAEVGIDDDMSRYNMGSAKFIVEAHRNGKWEKVFESSIIKLGEEPQKVEADISGADQVRLTTTDAGDGISCDVALWADARLE